MPITALSIIGFTSLLIASFGDFIINFLVGLRKPGYRFLEDTMSELGSKKSPFKKVFLVWWILWGLLLTIFSLSFGFTVNFEDGFIFAIVILIAVFGFGAGVIAALFPEDAKNEPETISGKIHGISAGLGFLGVMVLPGISLGHFTFGTYPVIFILSLVFLVLGLVFFNLFLIAENPKRLKFAGLWQRLFLLSCFSYLIALGLHMLLL